MAWGSNLMQSIQSQQQQRNAALGGQTPQALLGQAGQMGYFSPQGSPFMQAMRRREALRNAQNRRQRGSILNQISGLDPSQSRFLLAQNEAGIAGDTANALNSAAFQDAQGNQDWFRGLFLNRLGRQDELDNQAYQRRMMKQQQRGAFLGGLGQLAGLGILNAPWGQWLGKNNDDPRGY